MSAKSGVAMFLPFMIVVTIVALVALGYAMQKNNVERRSREALGQQALSLVKVYAEGARAELFIEQSVRYADVVARDVLARNGGYAAQNACTRLASDTSLVIMNTCGTFQPEKEYERMLRAEVAEFLKYYQSPYKAYASSSGQAREANGQGAYTEVVWKASVKKVERVSEQLVVEMMPLVYVPEGAPRASVYTVTPKIVLPDTLDVYARVYLAADACIGKTVEACQGLFQKEFPASTVVSDGAFWKVRVLTGEETIQFALDQSKALPLREVSASMAV